MSAFARLAAERAERVSAALKASVALREPWKISIWDEGLRCSSTVDRGGVPVNQAEVSATELAADLQKYAPRYIGEKQQCPLLLSYATHLSPERGGHRDDDCKSITGIILDCDRGGDPVRIRAALEAAGAAYTFSFKPATKKFHVILQLKEQIVPPGDRRLYAGYHHSLFLHAIKAFSDLGGIVFDPAMAPILMHIDFPACRKIEEDTVPVVEGHDGGPVDLDAFCRALGWVPPPPPTLYRPKKEDASDATSVTAAELQRFLLGKAHALSFRGYTEKSLKHGDRLRVALAGEKAPCAPGELRNQIWYREIAGTAGVAVSNRFPNVESETLATLLTEVFDAALKRQHEQDTRAGLHASPASADKLEDMFLRSILDIRSRAAAEK